MAELSSMQSMLRNMPQVGTIHWIGLRTAKKGSVTPVPRAMITLDQGLVGDHFSGKPGAKRQVTLIQQEHFAVMASMLGVSEILPELFRRNIVISGINLNAMRDCQFQIGDAILEGSGPCAPCSMIEKTFGPGAYNISRGHSGITARVIKAGEIWVGCRVKFLSSNYLPTSDDE